MAAPPRARGKAATRAALCIGVACAAASPPAAAGGNLELVCGSPILSNPTCAAGQIVDRAWAPGATPVRWWINDQGARSNTEHGGSPLTIEQIVREVQAAFGDAQLGWEAVPESAIRFRYMGTTGDSEPGVDNRNLVLWSDTGLGGSTLAITIVASLAIDVIVTDSIRDLNGDGVQDLDPALYPSNTRLNAGTIIDADIVLNSGAFDWALVPDSTPDICDLRAVALHEVGHFQGLSHSAVLNPPATMFPFFDTASAAQQQEARTLEWDDIVPSMRAYPVAGVGPTGSISGKVVRGTSTGVVGAQVSAVELATGRTVEAVFSNSSAKVGGGGAGTYKLDRLPPGTYLISVDYLRRAGHAEGGWRWLNAERIDYNETVKLANFDPRDLSPELLSTTDTENNNDDLSAALQVTLSAGQQRTLSNLFVNYVSPLAPAGASQLYLSDDTIVTHVPISFPFSFFGVPYTKFAAYANGYITFCRDCETDLDLLFDESGANFFALPRVAGLLRDLDPGADSSGNGGRDVYVRLGPSLIEVIWLAVPEKVSPYETGLAAPTPFGANTFTIGFDNTGKVWMDYQRLSSPYGIAGLASGTALVGVAERFDFGRPRPGFPERPTLEEATSISGVRVEFIPHALGGYTARSAQWTAPEAAPPGAPDGLRAEGGAEVTYLRWPDAGTPRYHLYRGRIAELRAGAGYTTAGSCFATLEQEQALDIAAPPPGDAFYYLVTAVREFGIEGSLGKNSLGAERPNAVPCRIQ
jgi:hypothetical protein